MNIKEAVDQNIERLIGSIQKIDYKDFLPLLNELKFPEDKKRIAALSHDEKMEWYATRDAQEMVWLGNDPEFKRFWKWNVMMPMKIKRLFYRIKNGEIFKRYHHITEMKEKVKKHSI